MKPTKSEIIEVLLDHIQTVRNSHEDVVTRELNNPKAVKDIECLKAAIRSVRLTHAADRDNPPLA